MPVVPLRNANFHLDTSGVAGFFGGEEAISAMATVKSFEGGRWLGWYNSPGSFVVAKRYGQLANSRFWEALYPGGKGDPATLFELEGEGGPEFMAAHSGTRIKDTGHVGSLFFRMCLSFPATKMEGRMSTPKRVTIATLATVPDPQLRPVLPGRRRSTAIAFIPISFSVGACILCGFFRDWFCFSMILLGILAGGISYAIIGSAAFIFNHPRPAPGSPMGNGILKDDYVMVVLLGEEGAVNSVTRGAFSLRFSGEPKRNEIGFAAMLLTTQFLLQLVLIPQGTLFGQLMFVLTFVVSWIYNCYLSSIDKGKIQSRILFDNVLGRPKLRSYMLGTLITAVVFVLLVLQPSDPARLLDELLPNNTETWKIWKRNVLDMLRRGRGVFSSEEFDFCDVDGSERALLETPSTSIRFLHTGHTRPQRKTS
jgi:hypothetical protein